MNKLIARAACIMVLGAFCAVPAAKALESVQRGSQGESRTLTGHVLNGQNEPLQKAIVYIKNTKTLAIKTYISEPDGSYRFPGLAANVDYEVYAEHEGARSDTKTLSGFDSRKQATITLKIHGK
ncbi:MAG TPA: carboxypeptidase-like regulatory domain-containing protein [Candidatus Angelobacter sp.]|nr:carboxypeptidase-like regulatory domain-containing protein [Candidatus Angelobacter sp.]